MTSPGRPGGPHGHSAFPSASIWYSGARRSLPWRCTPDHRMREVRNSRARATIRRTQFCDKIGARTEHWQVIPLATAIHLTDHAPGRTSMTARALGRRHPVRSLLVAAALVAPAVAFAQSTLPSGNIPAAPIGHRQPTAGDVPSNDSVKAAPGPDDLRLPQDARNEPFGRP